MDSQHHTEFVQASVFVAVRTQIVGRVTIGANSSAWLNAVLRGETNQIAIGERTNVQDGAIIHVDTCRLYLISSSVTIGHASEVHRAVVDDDVLIGIGAKNFERRKNRARMYAGRGHIDHRQNCYSAEVFSD